MTDTPPIAHAAGPGAGISAVPRRAHLAAIADFALEGAEARVAAASMALETAGSPACATDAPPPPASCIAWLAEMVLLHGVPFDYLVPVAAMLPVETIRFFYLDQNYTNKMVDGAASVGIGSSTDTLALYASIEALANQSAEATSSVRATRLGRPSLAAGGPASTMTGFLLRSAVVAGWPGIEVAASDADGALPLLRLERLAPDVLICILGGVPASVQIIQPSESLHFGVIDDGHGNLSGTLRSVGVGTVAAGMQIGSGGSAVTFPVTTRTGTGAVPGVVAVAKTAAAITQALQTAGALPPGGVTGAEFGVEMVQAAGVQPFVPPPAPPPPPPAAIEGAGQ